jgi:hypothetical protein
MSGKGNINCIGMRNKSLDTAIAIAYGGDMKRTDIDWARQLKEEEARMLRFHRDHIRASYRQIKLIRDRAYQRARRDAEKRAWTDALGEGWIKWVGGDCPIPPDTLVLFRVPHEITLLLEGCDPGITGDIPRRADSLNWQRTNPDPVWSTDIAAYKVINEGLLSARRSREKE